MTSTGCSRRLGTCFLDHGFIKLQSPAGSFGDFVESILERIAVRDEKIEQRVTVRMKYFEAGAVGDGREEMGGHLRFLVVSHRHAKGAGERGNPTPLSGAAAPARIEVAEIDGALEHEVPATRARDFALPCGHRNFPDATYIGHGFTIIVPTARFFEPHDVKAGDPASELDGIAQLPTLVGVNAYLELWSHGASCGLHPLDIRGRGEASDFELASAQPHALELNHFVGKIA